MDYLRASCNTLNSRGNRHSRQAKRDPESSLARSGIQAILNPGLRQVTENVTFAGASQERNRLPHKFFWMKDNREKGKFIFGSCLIVFVILWTLGAGSLNKGSDEMEVTGKVYVMGNEPFTQVAIETKDGQVYVLLGEETKELRRLQGRRVLVVGKPSKEKPRGAKAIELRSFEVLNGK